MKKLISISALLSLILLIAQPLRAQVKVLSSSFEISKSKLLFKGDRIKLDVYDQTIDITNTLTTPLTTTSSDNTPNVSLPLSGRINILGSKNGIAVGNSDKPLHSVYATTLYSSTNSVSTFSDRRYKTNIEDLTPATDKIMQLRPVKFDYREEKDGERSTDPRRLNRVGLIAQELMEVVPEAVSYLEEGDVYTVDYATLIPFLIKTAQEQQTLIENQQLQIEELQMALTADNAAMVTPTFSNTKPNGNATETVEAAGNRLWSNVPNPFKQETRIRYALTEDVRDAQLCIYDLSGKQLSCHRLNDRGESEFVLRAATLNPGIYLYSLIADGQVVDTHRMVVTE